jgi:hypothetical protein
MNRWPAKWGLNAAGSPLMFTPGESSMRTPPEPVRIESVPGLRDGSPGMHEATEPRPPRRGFFMPACQSPIEMSLFLPVRDVTSALSNACLCFV